MRVQFRGIQVFRRLVQAGTVSIIFGLFFLSLYAHYRKINVTGIFQFEISPIMERIMPWIEGLISGMDNPEEFLDNFKGSLWSLRVAGFDISDPLGFVEMTFASGTFYMPMFISILIPVVFTLLMGRVFCSWLCPGYLVFELGSKLRKLLRYMGLKTEGTAYSMSNKYIFLVVGLFAAFLFSIPLFVFFYPPAVLSRIAHGWVFSAAFFGGLWVILTILLFELFVSPRWWCRTMCPGGALYGLLGMLRPVKVETALSECTHCGLCSGVCEPGINPVTDSESIECDNCGACVTHCPEGALYYTIKRPKFNKIFLRT